MQQQEQLHASQAGSSISFNEKTADAPDGDPVPKSAISDNADKFNSLYLLIVSEQQDRVLLAPVHQSTTIPTTTCRRPPKWTLPRIQKYNLNPSFFEDVLREANKQLCFRDTHLVGLRLFYKRDYFVGTHRCYNYIMMFVWLDKAMNETPREFDWVQLDSEFDQRYPLSLPQPEMLSIVRRVLRQLLAPCDQLVSSHSLPTPTIALHTLKRNYCGTPSHSPWTTWDGFRKIWDWSSAELNKLRIACDRHPLQIRLTPESTVWCFPKKEDDSNGDFIPATIFLKWTHGCANDAGITSVLSAHIPDLVAPPLSVDIRNQVMLLKAFGGKEIGSNDIVNRKQKSIFMSDLRKLHRISGDLVESLLSVGLPLLSTEWQREHLGEILYAPEAENVYEKEEYHDIDRTVVHRKLTEWLLKLEGRGNAIGTDQGGSTHAFLPQNCLVHLDYDLGNIIMSHQSLTNEQKGAVRNDDDQDELSVAFKFFDFGSAVCAHPAFDLIRCSHDAIAQYCGGRDQPFFNVVLEQVELASSLVYLFDAFRFLSRSRQVRQADERQLCICMFRCHFMDVLDSL